MISSVKKKYKLQKLERRENMKGEENTYLVLNISTLYLDTCVQLKKK